ncbi:MAG TPA: hypothetical protein VHR66_25055 [Gemmataceae bacterium]|jgi:hypothetical protein|nr:hypothetical protein [Gemmataceae bacterium]
MKTKEKRRGRPKKSSEDTLSTSTLLRLQHREKSAFEDAAKLAGIPLAGWMRERLRLSARAELEKAGKPVAFIDE